ncbi:MAG TPA: hypothetical protein VN372_10945 [Methanospirillum sp.]|nr:hypothetical protein [Methanospirillum sp.]
MIIVISCIICCLTVTSAPIFAGDDLKLSTINNASLVLLPHYNGSQSIQASKGIGFDSISHGKVEIPNIADHTILADGTSIIQNRSIFKNTLLDDMLSLSKSELFTTPITRTLTPTQTCSLEDQAEWVTSGPDRYFVYTMSYINPGPFVPYINWGYLGYSNGLDQFMGITPRPLYCGEGYRFNATPYFDVSTGKVTIIIVNRDDNNSGGGDRKEVTMDLYCVTPGFYYGTSSDEGFAGFWSFYLRRNTDQDFQGSLGGL